MPWVYLGGSERRFLGINEARRYCIENMAPDVD